MYLVEQLVVVGQRQLDPVLARLLVLVRDLRAHREGLACRRRTSSVLADVTVVASISGHRASASSPFTLGLELRLRRLRRGQARSTGNRRTVPNRSRTGLRRDAVTVATRTLQAVSPLFTKMKLAVRAQRQRRRVRGRRVRVAGLRGQCRRSLDVETGDRVGSRSCPRRHCLPSGETVTLKALSPAVGQGEPSSWVRLPSGSIAMAYTAETGLSRSASVERLPVRREGERVGRRRSSRTVSRRPRSARRSRRS